MLRAVDAVFPPRLGIAELMFMVMRIYCDVGVRMILFDEAHNMLPGSPRQQRRILTHLRYLSNELRVGQAGSSSSFDRQHRLVADNMKPQKEPIAVLRAKEVGSPGFKSNATKAFSTGLPGAKSCHVPLQPAAWRRHVHVRQHPAIASSVRVSGDRDRAATSVISSSFSERRSARWTIQGSASPSRTGASPPGSARRGPTPLPRSAGPPSSGSESSRPGPRSAPGGTARGPAAARGFAGFPYHFPRK